MTTPIRSRSNAGALIFSFIIPEYALPPACQCGGVFSRHHHHSKAHCIENRILHILIMSEYHESTENRPLKITEYETASSRMSRQYHAWICAEHSSSRAGSSHGAYTLFLYYLIRIRFIWYYAMIRIWHYLERCWFQHMVDLHYTQYSWLLHDGRQALPIIMDISIVDNGFIILMIKYIKSNASIIDTGDGTE